MSAPAKPVISFIDVSVAREGRVILDKLSFDIPQRSFGAVVGPSGSGKTTIFNVMAGFVRPDSGQVLVVGQDVTAMNESRLAEFRNRTVATIFQAYNLVSDYTLLENVLLPALVRNKSADVKRACSCLEHVGLAERLYDTPSRLSGGEKQRLAIARTLYMRPRLLLADEPTGNLDASTAQGVLDALRMLHDEGTSVLIATHDSFVIEQVPIIMNLNGEQHTIAESQAQEAG